ncbi:hypothetical protein ACT4MK_18220 [Bradyrhizobium barranii]|uniref:hypothetical protein n=1 Tax=Bradyrhizobium barranii TaxID=2992140 RepID=UPI0040346069
MARNDLKKGDLVYGQGGKAEIVDKRRARIAKGVFLTSMPAAGKPAQRYRLPLEFQEFEQAVNLADQLAVEDKIAMAKQNQSAFIDDMVMRLKCVRAGLDAVAEKTKRK